jgi:2-dehydropantoate 2-reductase
MMRDTEIAVLGAGAIGSIIGAHLGRAGHRVAMIARGERARKIRDEGLRITGLVEFTAPVQVITDPGSLRSADVLIVATKALNTAAALEPLREARFGVALSLQNGVMKDELLGGAFGPDHVLGALANISGELMPSGTVDFTRNFNLLIGESSGRISTRASRVADAIDASGVHANVVPDIRAQEWSKFAGWVGMVALAVTTRRNTWEYLLDPDAALVLVKVVREVGQLAQAWGIALADGGMLAVARICRESERDAVKIVTDLGREFRAGSPGHRISTLQDLEAGRRLEIGETVGYAVRKGRELGLNLPALEMVLHLAIAIERIGHTEAALPNPNSPG